MKHNTAFNSGKLLLVFRNIATQLAKANEKFIYGALKQGGRAKEFEDSIFHIHMKEKGIYAEHYNGVLDSLMLPDEGYFYNDDNR